MLKTYENPPLLKNEQDSLYFREECVIVCPGDSCQDLQDADWRIKYPKRKINGVRDSLLLLALCASLFNEFVQFHQNSTKMQHLKKVQNKLGNVADYF